MIFEVKNGAKSYCATCGKEIKLGELVAFSTTKSGTMKMHHMDCKK
jgi:hypothetical protein